MPPSAALSVAQLIEKIEAVGPTEGIDGGCLGITLAVIGGRALVVLGPHESTRSLDGKLARFAWVCPTPTPDPAKLLEALRELGDLQLRSPAVASVRTIGPTNERPKDPTRRVLVIETLS